MTFLGPNLNRGRVTISGGSEVQSLGAEREKAAPHCDEVGRRLNKEDGRGKSKGMGGDSSLKEI